MAITLIPHQPIDFSYLSPDTDEELSTYALHYNLTDNPMFQFKNTTGTSFLVTIEGSGETVQSEVYVGDYTISGDYVTFTLNFDGLGLSAGCYSLNLYTITTSGTNLITNGTFGSDISGWTAADVLELEVDSYSNESAEAACDGEVILAASGGVAVLTYSKDGIAYQASSTFSGLCTGEYTFYVKDANELIVTLDLEIFTNIDCGDYSGSEAFDLITINTSQLLTCECFDFV
jgi:hypothetical protein